MKQVRTLRRFATYIAAALLLPLSGCEIINPEEEVPAYIHIPAFELITSFDQGTAAHNITDAWVYVDQDIQGVYELPVTFPVLAAGKHTISLRPGIKINGIASTRISYPFFESRDFHLELQPGKIDTLRPVTAYQEETDFAWIENFESPGISMEATPGSDTAMGKQKDEAFEGAFSGVIHLNDERSYFEAVTINAYKLPTGLTPSYLEMNFKTNNTLVVGLIANSPGSVKVLEILVLNPTDEWKKIYVNLGATVSRQSGVVDYNVILRAGLDEGIEEAEILVDNLKLVHF